jgi:dihydroorotase-like cyclic amidohydrolase
MGDGYGVYLKTVADWDNVFCDMIRGSAVTFLELPNEENPGETAHAIRDWYAGRKVEAVIRYALARGKVAAQIENLGETSHGGKGTRVLFKITLDDPKPARAAADIAHHIESVGSQIKEKPIQRARRLASNFLNATVRRGKK